MTFCSVAVANEAKTSAINSLGEKMNFERVDGAPSSSRSTDEAMASEVEDLNGGITSGVKVILVNGEARVGESDVMAINGVMHVVDTLLPTESAMPVSTLLESRNLTVFKQLIELNGFDEELDTYVNVSIFAPTDDALANNYWAKKIESEPDSLKGNAELTAFLKYHIAKPLTKTCDLSETQLDTEAGDKVRVNLYSTVSATGWLLCSETEDWNLFSIPFPFFQHTIFSNVLNRATVNCARLVHFDDDSCGSVLHQVDRILEPPTQNLLQLIESNEEYSKFAELVKEANLTDLLSNTNRSLTILIPKNDIFSEVKDYFDELRKDENKNLLEDVIKAHIIDGEYLDLSSAVHRRIRGLSSSSSHSTYVNHKPFLHFFRRPLLRGHRSLRLAIRSIGKDHQWFQFEIGTWSSAENSKRWRHQMWYYCQEWHCPWNQRFDQY